jgi:lipopolysaccharide biosynthesis glycosyltransferase
MEIVACFNHGFVMPTGVMMYSLCKNNSDTEVNFHLMVDESVSEEDRNDLLNTVSVFRDKKIIFYTMDSQSFEGLPPTLGHIMSSSTYYRLSVAEVLPRTIDKVLYLDGDLIVRQSLLPLWETDISGFAVAAIYERSYQMFPELYGDYFDRLGYSPQLGYFNAGVMLINLDYWRRNGIGKQLADCLKDNPEKIKQGDQDALNCILCESKLELPPRYNFQSSYLYTYCFNKAMSESVVREAVEDPVIVHFISEKPWNKYIRELHPYRSTFFKYQNETKWKGMRTERRTMKMKVVNAIADLLRFLKLKAPLKESFVNIKSID